jgi:hypothetical protein
MYDKAGGRVLRVETTINAPGAFKVYRAKENDPEGQKDWRVLRSGVADLHRRAQVSQAANARYLDGLAAVEHEQPLHERLEPLARRVTEPGAGGRKLRGLAPLVGPDAALLEAISRPEFAVNGLRNRDVVAALDSTATTGATARRRRAAQVSRQLRLLRAHGLLKKVPKFKFRRKHGRSSDGCSAAVSVAGWLCWANWRANSMRGAVSGRSTREFQ